VSFLTKFFTELVLLFIFNEASGTYTSALVLSATDLYPNCMNIMDAKLQRIHFVLIQVVSVENWR
jgi:hypothetical protein